jgi:AraC family transcriptional regulator
MVLHQFPDLQWLKQQAEQRFSDRKAANGRILLQAGWPTVVLNVKTTQIYRDNIRGPFSLFANISGESFVKADLARKKVNEDFFFLTNHDQHYTLEVDKKQNTETFNIHFGEYFADKVFESLRKPVQKLIDNHFEAPCQSLAFHNRLQPHDGTTKQLLLKIKADDGKDQLLLEETLFDLLSHVFGKEKEIRKNAAELPVMKSSTRTELFQRLLLATDYIYSFFDQSLSLDELANVSCLSKFHFLRLFKIAFQKTPHQFINEVRLQKAKELLRKSTLDIHQIAQHTGFSNSSSFSRMFYQNTGAYPSQFRING